MVLVLVVENAFGRDQREQSSSGSGVRYARMLLAVTHGSGICASEMLAARFSEFLPMRGVFATTFAQ
jgi:hypothetical protein